ncbi:hypothetical protein ACROYT_G027159 [Oculina patagonica]
MAEKELEFLIPTLSSNATEEEKNLSLKEKVNLIDNEIRQLYEFCTKAGYTQPQIEQCAQPLLALQNREMHIKWFRRLFSFALLVALIAFLFAYDPTYRQICIYGKFITMKALPYWDWTEIYDRECIIDNPYYVRDEMTEEDCNVCRKLRSIKRVSNVSQSDIADDYLFSNVPVIVTDAMDDWDALKTFDINFLAELYGSNEVLRDSPSACQFQSTTPEYGTPQQLLSAVKSGELQKFQAFWENCEKESAKVFRQYYRRPYFLPPMAEATEGNWFIVSSEESKTLTVSWDASATWMAQVKRSARFRLTPNDICRNICHKIVVKLDPGEVLTVPDKMWSVSYKPVGSDPVVTFGSGVTWD